MRYGSKWKYYNAHSHSHLQSHLHACTWTMNKLIRISQHCWIVADDYSYSSTAVHSHSHTKYTLLVCLCTWKSLDTCRFIGRFPLELYADFPCLSLRSQRMHYNPSQRRYLLLRKHSFGSVVAGRQHARMHTFKSGRKQLAIIYTMYLCNWKFKYGKSV